MPQFRSRNIPALLITSALMSPFAVSAETQAVINGRVEFYADYLEQLLPGASAAYADDSTGKADLEFQSRGRVDISVMDVKDLTEFGGFARIEVNSSAQSVNDTDAHIFLKDSFGKLQLGTDIDAEQDAFETGLAAAGPLSPDKSVSGAKAAHGFTKSALNEATVVYTSPTILGLTGAAEVDADGDWAGSLKYLTSVGTSDVKISLAADESGAVGSSAVVNLGPWILSAFAGLDGDEDSYAGAGVGYEAGALKLSAGASQARSDRKTDSRATETDLTTGASFTLAPGLSIAGSAKWQQRTAKDALTVEQDLDFTQLRARLRLDF